MISWLNMHKAVRTVPGHGIKPGSPAFQEDSKYLSHKGNPQYFLHVSYYELSNIYGSLHYYLLTGNTPNHITSLELTPWFPEPYMQFHSFKNVLLEYSCFTILC